MSDSMKIKQLTCEMCGSKDLLKQEGVFVCQSCGTKYSVEEAKKMMVEGSVEIKGAVKIDETDKAAKLLLLAQEELGNNNAAAADYANQVLVIDSNNAEAWFIKASCILDGGSSLANMKFRSAIDYGSKAIMYTQDADRKNEMKNYLMPEVRGTIEALLINALVLKDKWGYLVNLFTLWANAIVAFGLSEYEALQEITYIKQLEKDQVPRNGLATIGSMLTGFKVYAKTPASNFVAIRVKESRPEFSHIVTTPPKSGGCYVATAVYGSYDCPQVWTLRRYRDYTLAGTWYGRAFIKTYYAISPTLVKWFGDTNWFKKMWQGKLDRMVAKLQAKGVESTPYEDKNW